MCNLMQVFMLLLLTSVTFPIMVAIMAAITRLMIKLLL